jgi:arylsulfatase A
MKLNRYTLTLALVPYLVVVCLLCPKPCSAGKPNFVPIVADELGYGDVDCYGSTVNETPHIDALATAGVRFTDFHSAGPMCSPTRAAMLTGS